MRNDPLEGCVREKREGEREKAKDCKMVRGRKIWRRTQTKGAKTP